MKKYRQLIGMLACAALCLTFASVAQTSAYFTAYTDVQGSFKVVARDTRTVPEEEGQEMQKIISVANTGSVECWARVKIFHGSALEVEIVKGDNWYYNEADGYYYYGSVLQPGEKTATSVTATAKADNEKILSDFNVVVVTESVPVLYAENGSVIPFNQLDWSIAASEWEREVY